MKRHLGAACAARCHGACPLAFVGGPRLRLCEASQGRNASEDLKKVFQRVKTQFIKTS